MMNRRSFLLAAPVLLLPKRSRAQLMGYDGIVNTGSASSSYTAQAVRFAVGAHLNPSGATPPADSPFLSFSLWTLNPTAAFNFGPNFFFSALSNYWGLFAFENSAGDLTFSAKNAASSAVFFQVSSGVVYSANTWYNFLGSMDTNHASGSRIINLYVSADGAVNDTPVTLGGTGSQDTGAAFSIPFTSAGAWTNSYFNGPNSLNQVVDYADIWWAPGQFVDFSVTANRRKFISASGKPVNLGASGVTPTGTAPFAFFSGPFTTFATNLGTGDTFTASGALSASPSAP